MSHVHNEVTGWSLASTLERDRSQMPLWPELETELEQVLAAQVHAASGVRVGDMDQYCHEVMPSPAAERTDSAMTLPLQIDGESGNKIVIKVSRVGQTEPALLPGEHRLDARAEAFPNADAELGQRLRAARERAEIGRDEIARRTRIAPTLIQAIEEGRFERLGATVFARGYLRSYARAVDLPEAVVAVWEGRVHRVLEDAPAPSLAATSPRRSSRQVASPIVYTLLTVLIAVPAYYGVRQAQQSPLLRTSAPVSIVATDKSGALKPLDRPASADTASPLPAERSVEVLATGAQVAESWRQPVMASLTPMLGAARDSEVLAAPLDVRRVQVRLTAPSWIEIVASDGRVIERSLLPAGSIREYSVPRSALLRIGDVGAVELRADGKVIDLVPFTNANVATLTMEQAG